MLELIQENKKDASSAGPKQDLPHTTTIHMPTIQTLHASMLQNNKIRPSNSPHHWFSTEVNLLKSKFIFSPSRKRSVTTSLAL